jgi:hypothetical protein
MSLLCHPALDDVYPILTADQARNLYCRQERCVARPHVNVTSGCPRHDHMSRILHKDREGMDNCPACADEHNYFLKHWAATETVRRQTNLWWTQYLNGVSFLIEPKLDEELKIFLRKHSVLAVRRLG